MPNRYNEIGLWKPMLAGGDADSAEDRAHAAATDPKLVSTLFYLYYTRHRVVEFVVRSGFKLPDTHMIFAAGRLHLHICEPVDRSPNAIVYDGWHELESTEPEEVEEAFRKTSQTLNRLSFAYNSRATWRLKYLLYPRMKRGYETPGAEDLPRLIQFLEMKGSEKETSLLDAAVDWYNHAKSSGNVLNEFLAYYVAIEGIAMAVSDGRADFDLGIPKDTKSERRTKKEDCIANLHTSLFTSDPTQFVQRAYFDCIHGIKKKTRKIVETVLGPESEAVRDMFERKVDGYSLNDLRNQIAHGTFSPSGTASEHLVAKRTGDIANIAREFLNRLILRIPQSQSLPSWSGKHQSSLSVHDPRDLWLVSHHFIAGKDWRIRPEWCE